MYPKKESRVEKTIVESKKEQGLDKRDEKDKDTLESRFRESKTEQEFMFTGTKGQ